MEHPFFDFVIKIGNDPDALARFKKDPNNPETAKLTAEQRTALLSGSFDPVQKLLFAENPNANPALVAAANTSKTPLMIGWNMAPLIAAISGKPAKP